MTETVEPSDSKLTAEEFMVSVELFATRKIPINRRKSNWRESTTAEEGPRKIKEKSSWLALPRTTAGSGQWRPASCKLLDEDNSCLLHIYVDETFLYQTVYVHKLNQTDISLTDSSLLMRKNCITIHSAGGQRWNPSFDNEPLYLHFSGADTCRTWLVLLKSYAKPELCGQYLLPSDGGLYRMWRQVELTVVQGRNLGTAKGVGIPEASSSVTTIVDPDSRGEGDANDYDVLCEICLNGTVYGRTTLKKGAGSPEWHEDFTFSDLPPFGTLEIAVLREKRLSLKSVLLGTIQVVLGNFRRHHLVEGWYPVLQSSNMPTRIQVGELRLKLRVDEEMVLPQSCYSMFLQALHSRNVLDWMGDFERDLGITTLSQELVHIAIARKVLLQELHALADREVDGSPHMQNTLFRGNTALTKMMEHVMKFYGAAFLEISIGSIVRRLCDEKVVIEVDPVRNTKGSKDLDRNMEQLTLWCQEIWDQVYSARSKCPQELRQLFEHIRKLVEQRFATKGNEERRHRHLPFRGVSAFCFLRFIVPGILTPHLFGLYPGLPSASAQRSLTLVAKVLQTLANLQHEFAKEDHMRGANRFLELNLPGMMDYILTVSTPIAESRNLTGDGGTHKHELRKVSSSLHHRRKRMQALEKEALPLLPHLLDHPRYLAVISSTIVRSARAIMFESKAGTLHESKLQELCARSFELEEQALRRVSSLTGSDPSRPTFIRWDVPGPPLLVNGSLSSLSLNLPLASRTLDMPSPAARGSVDFSVSYDNSSSSTKMQSNCSEGAEVGYMAVPSVLQVSRTLSNEHALMINPGSEDEASKRKRNIFPGFLSRR